MSVNRIRGDGGVIIDSQTFLELPKAPTKNTSYAVREGMLRYNKGWNAFEGVLKFEDGTVAYRRFANLDSNGRLLTSQLPDSVTSGMQYVGTYSPISDDIDPPISSTVYHPLPAPAASLNGDYYIVRSIMDAAQKHYEANSPTTSTVVFTPVNPSGQGNWIQIKYYLDTNPVDSTKKIVSAAFARIVTASIPATGHAGLVSLAQDTDLTAAFTATNAQGELALTDGDWVIITSTRVQRIRQSRVGILASAVLFDNTIITSSNRQFSTSSATAQTVIDNLAINDLRRTGDSMYNDGTKGAGRFGITYGSATAPSMSFNNAIYDPVANPGNDPSKWTDNNTGLFHPADDAIGHSTGGVERLRIDNTGLKIYQPSTASGTGTPAIQLLGSGNTVAMGITALNNNFLFSSVNKIQVEFRDGVSVFHGTVNIDNNITAGGTASITGNTTLGGTLTVAGATTLSGALVANSTADLRGNTTIGSTTANTLTVNSTSTFQGGSTFNGTSNRFRNINLVSAGILTLESVTNQSTIALSGSDLRFSMGNFADVTILDGTTIRTRLNRYGVQLPVLATVDNSVGVDGMIAYSTQRNTVMQKSNGAWTTVSGGGVEVPFTTSSWVLSGSSYSITVTNSNIQSVSVQELSGSNYSQVEVDSIVISSTNAVVSIPSTPDFRFNGRLIVTYR